MKHTLTLLTALLEPSAQSRRLLTRRETLMTVGAGVAAMLLPGSVRGQQDTRGGTDLGAAGSGLGGFTFTITGKDFNFLFRTLQNEGSLKVLSRPQIMAMDNQEAIINVSDNVPYVSGTQTSSTGQISTQVNRRDVGIVLTVTPQINPEGFVRMHVRQEVNEISGSTIDVGQGVTSPIFFVREAETDLMVRDNETIVLGGLIETRNENREQKVPILGDIPGLGLLFRNQNDSQQRAELLIVLTPHVIRSPEEFRELSIAEVGNMELIPAESLSDELMQGLQVHLDEFSEGGEYAIPEEGAAPPPAAPAEEPAEEVYGPVRPALHPDRREDLDPNSYDVPREWRTGRHRA
jgi:type II secretory pathway component GspD/PulD (secretin)